jgi:tetratricopeptide (TPR) repeat protein
MDRLGMLEKMVAAKPGEPFVRYGLAMEYKKVGRNEDAAQAFAALAEQHGDYVPGYLMHGNLLETMGRGAEAVAVYERGIEVASAASDDHAASELAAALQAARDALS